MCSGEGPIGAAKGKQTNTMASCQTPPQQPSLVHRAHDVHTKPIGLAPRAIL